MIYYSRVSMDAALRRGSQSIERVVSFVRTQGPLGCIVRIPMKLSRNWLLALVLTACGSDPASPSPSPSPSPPHPCTQIGCTDEARVVTRLNAEQAAPGSHAWVVTVDGESFTCTSTVTRPGQDNIDCGEHASMLLVPVAEGVDLPSSDGTVMHGFRTVPGAFEWRLTLVRTPSTIHIVHTRDGAPVSDHTGSFTYADHSPNGVACGPTCRQAQLDW